MTMVGGAIALVALAATVALAVHDEGFQLDGNTLAANTTTGYPTPTSTLPPAFAGPNDWDSLFDAAGAKRNPLPAGFNDATFRKDFATKLKGQATVFDTSDPSTFTTGSKDTLNINQWRCVGANNVTDKGDIMNAYTSVFVNAEGQRILYFAIEKHIDNGSNNVGFWFLGDNNAACADGGSGNGNAFTGAHADGDLLIVSEFSNGGGVSTIKAFRWEGSNPGALNQTPVEVGVDCVRGSDASQNLDMCATTNILPHTPIWPHASKTLGLNSGYPAATFFEGGINLSNTVFADACFNRFLADTRSSPSVTADLYDYTSGTIGACGSIKVIKVTGPDSTDVTDFDFTTTEPAGKTNVPDTFKLDTDPSDPTAATDQFPSERTFTSIPAGSYTIKEEVEAGWYLDSIVCTKAGAPFSNGDTVNVGTGVASFSTSGHAIVCTYTNYKPSAFLDIEPDDVNRVGENHTFKVTAWKNDGKSATNVKAGGVLVSVTLADANGAGAGGNQQCTTNNTANDPDFGTCGVTFTSQATGTVTGTASATINAFGVSIAATTAANSTTAAKADALKKFVDAAIDIEGDGVNRVGQTHTFKVTTYAEGSGSAASMAKVGGIEATVKFTETNGADAIPNKTCTTSTTAGADFGTCTVSFSSDKTGINTAHATATITVEGKPIDVDSKTDNQTAGAEEVEKKWVDAAIDIAGDGVNRVDANHEFTVTTYAEGSGDGAQMAPVGGVTVTVKFAADNGTDPIADKTCVTSLVAGPTLGTCSVSFTSGKTGTHTGTAIASITVETKPINVTTTADSTSGGAADALKQWVDAALDIAGDGVNKVGANHQFTVTAWADSSTAGGFAKVGGVLVTVKFAAANGTDPIADKTCITDSSGPTLGTCQVTFTSSKTGTHTGTAAATITVNGKGVEVTTTADSTSPEAADALKRWVNAKIEIAGTAVNRVGEAHTFTATLSKDTGDGNGFVAAAGEHVTHSLTDANTAASVLDAAASTCDNAGANTDTAGKCTIVFTSNSTGTVTGGASATLTIPDANGASVTVSTDGVSPNSGTVVKTFVDAKISITPDDINGIGESHTFVVKVEKDTGGAGGFGPAEGEHVNFTLTPGGSAVAIVNAAASTCDNLGPNTNAQGECTIVFTSNLAGTITGNASATVVIGTESIPVQTNGAQGSSGAAVKTFKAGTLIWHKVDNKLAPLAGATFEVCRTETLDSSTNPDSYTNNADVCVSVTDNGALDENPANGEFLMTGLILGTYSVRETQAPPGYHIDNPDAVNAGSMTLDPPPGDQDLEIVAPFVNSKAYQLIVFTCDDIANTLVVSTVTLGQTPATDTITAAQLAALGWLKSDGQGGTTPITEADLCALPGANFGNLDPNTYTPSVKLPK